MANWKKVIVSGSAAELASLQLDTALPVAQGGIGATSLTDKAVLISQDSGTDAVGSLALTSNGSLIIGGTSGPAVEAASDLAGSGLAATTGDGTLALSIGAGTGIDVAADAISVDVSDFMTNGSNNRIVTATGTDAMNAEANLTFDGSGLSVTGHVTASGNMSGSASSTGSFGRLQTAGASEIGGNLTQKGATFLLETSGTPTVKSLSNNPLVLDQRIPTNPGQVYNQLRFNSSGGVELRQFSTIGSNIFSTVAVAGQSNIVADSKSDTLTLAESTGLGITTNAGNDTVTFALDSAQTTIQTIFNTGLIVGRASGDTTIDFTADDVIVFDAGASEKMRVDTSGVDITGALTVSTNATIQGDLVVNGSTTTLSTTNLAVGDQFIFAATGSAGSNVDAGLVVQSGSAANTGSAFYHDINSQRWAVAKTVASNAVAVTPNQFVGTITLNSNPPSDSDGEYGVGEMWIETDTQDIFIRTG